MHQISKLATVLYVVISTEDYMVSTRCLFTFSKIHVTPGPDTVEAIGRIGVVDSVNYQSVCMYKLNRF